MNVPSAMADPLLPVDHRAATLERDQQAREDRDRRRDDDQHRANDQVETSLDDVAEHALPEPVAIDEPADLERFDRNLPVHALEIALEVGHLHAVQAALEQRAQRQHPTSLLAHGDDDLVDAELPHHVVERSAARHHASRRHDILLRLLERVEADQPQAQRIGRRQRRLDQPRFGSGPQDEDAMRHQMRHQRQDDHVPHQQQAEQREDDRGDPVVAQHVDAGHPVRDEKCERNADRRRKHDAQEVRAGRELLGAAVEAERAVQADDRQREQEREQGRFRMRDALLTVEAQYEHDRGEQPRELGAELEQRRTGNVLSK